MFPKKIANRSGNVLDFGLTHVGVERECGEPGVERKSHGTLILWELAK